MKKFCDMILLQLLPVLTVVCFALAIIVLIKTILGV